MLSGLSPIIAKAWTGALLAVTEHGDLEVDEEFPKEGRLRALAARKFTAKKLLTRIGRIFAMCCD